MLGIWIGSTWSRYFWSTYLKLDQIETTAVQATRMSKPVDCFLFNFNFNLATRKVTKKQTKRRLTSATSSGAKNLRTTLRSARVWQRARVLAKWHNRARNGQRTFIEGFLRRKKFSLGRTNVGETGDRQSVPFFVPEATRSRAWQSHEEQLDTVCWQPLLRSTNRCKIRIFHREIPCETAFPLLSRTIGHSSFAPRETSAFESFDHGARWRMFRRE